MARKGKSADESSKKSRKQVAVADEEAEGTGSLAATIWEQVGPLLIAVLIALGIRAVVIESYYVPSESMLPTLLIGDHVFVNKFVFGARIPFTGVHLPALRDPERGEIVVFALGRKGPQQICPLDECPDYPAEGFVKRIVGIPGDRIEYRDEAFYLNDARVPTTDLERQVVDNHGIALAALDESLPDCTHEVLDHPRRSTQNLASFVVPEGRYFFMGDNRDNSSDSRVWGTVPRTDLKGPIVINYWSWNNQESWAAMLNPLTWFRLLKDEMRWNRIGMRHKCTPDAER